tara:strand:- start:2065 stop:2379 length:315 start_codon:yes stop_codon:yes gene_type:complete
MFYVFHQNNSGGYFTKPAKNIIVKDARDEEHATEIALQAGMYFGGIEAGIDCECCGDRWYPMAMDFDTADDAIEYANQLNFSSDANIPAYVMVDDLDVEDTILE